MTFVNTLITNAIERCGILFDMEDFGTWLESQREGKGWTQAELARRAGLSQSAISLVVSGARKPGAELATAIARALKLPPEEVLRVAGLLPPNPASDEAEERASYLLRTLKTSASKKRAIDYLELLIQQEERDGHDDAQTTATQPR